MHKAAVEISIPFHDVDAMEVTWHGHYAKYFELARGAVLDSIAYNYPEMKASGYMWPVIDMRIRYPQASRCFQQIVVSATIVEWEHRLKIQYEIRDKESDRRLTHGYTVQVAVAMETGEMCYASPSVLVDKIVATVTATTTATTTEKGEGEL